MRYLRLSFVYFLSIIINLGLENDVSSVTDILARIDNSLEQNNIDSSSCVQRIICSYVNDAQKNMQTGEAGTVDQFVYTIAK